MAYLPSQPLPHLPQHPTKTFPKTSLKSPIKNKAPHSLSKPLSQHFHINIRESPQKSTRSQIKSLSAHKAQHIQTSKIFRTPKFQIWFFPDILYKSVKITHFSQIFSAISLSNVNSLLNLPINIAEAPNKAL